MRKLHFLLAILGVAASSVVGAQAVSAVPCATPDSVVFRGNRRTSDSTLRATVGIAPGSAVSAVSLESAIRNLYATGQFEQSIATTCETAGGKRVLVFDLRERGVAAITSGQDVSSGSCAAPDSIAFRGNRRVSESTLRATVGIARGTAVSAGSLSRAIRNLYATGQFEPSMTTRCETAGRNTVLVFTVKERRRDGQ